MVLVAIGYARSDRVRAAVTNYTLGTLKGKFKGSGKSVNKKIAFTSAKPGHITVQCHSGPPFCKGMEVKVNERNK